MKLRISIFVAVALCANIAGGQGSGWMPQVTYTVGAGPTRLDFGDLDEDGDPDVAVALQGGDGRYDWKLCMGP